MDLMVKYYIFLVLQACTIVSSEVLQEFSGLTISPSASFYDVLPITEGSHQRVTQETQITSNSFSPTSQPNASPHFESASGPQANNGLKPSLSPNTPLNEPPPSKDPGLLPDAAAPPITSIPEGSPPGPPVIPPTTPVSVPPIPQQDNGPDTKSPTNPPTASVQIAPPPKEVFHPPPVAQVAPSTSQVPPSMPEGPPFIVPEPVASPPTKLPDASPPTKLPDAAPPTKLPVASPPTKLPVASPPTKLPDASPPKQPTLPISPPNLPLPAEIPPSTLPSSPPAPPTLPVPPSNLSAPLASPPSTLPRNAPPTPPTLTVPPPNLPAPLVSPPSTLPINPPPTPPTLTVPPPNLPAPLASPPSTLPINPPPSPPTLTVPPPNLPAPLASPPSTLPTNPPPSPPTLNVPPPNTPAPLASPPSTLPTNPPPSPPTLNVPPPNKPAPLASPPSTLPTNPPPSPPTLNIPPPNKPAPLASPPSTFPRKSHPSPPFTSRSPPNLPVPVASPPYASQRNLPPPDGTFAESPSTYAVPPSNSPKNLHPIHQNSSSAPPPNIPAPIPNTNKGRNRFPVSSPPNRTTNIAPTHHSPEKAPIVHKAPPSSYNHAPPPTESRPPPSLPPVYPPPPPGPRSKTRHHNPPPLPSPESSPRHRMPPPPILISPSISPTVQMTMPVLPPKVSPSHASPRIPKPIQALPPPPPNEDCLSITCIEPLTNTPPGTPCNCVLPMQLELGLGVSIYTFFPLVSELAFEIAAGVFMRSSQVRIMGANEDSEDPEKTNVIINLVPLGEKFDNYTALVTAQRLWMKQVPIKSSLFGDYEVLFVKYPGLPPSPPSRSSGNGMNGEPYGHGNNGRDVKPLGVDVSKQRRNNRLNGGIIAIISLSVVVAVVLIGVTVWVLLFKRPVGARSGPNPPATFPPVTKSSGVGGSINGSGPESASLSFRSSIAYTGSAKTFSSSDMEKATDNFNEAGVLGEGGFGRVYSGVLNDGTKVAVKVLKRDDQQGGREFLAEVEMLSRLHHRNLVRLIGICTEERNRCLVYELIANGSVESHLHGVDKETSPLDWGARLKIALGAARGLAYLHEDSSPRVIHRDFKSSNILLEDDFTPKVSDFGLARTALDEDNRHISTRVMGTFGYVAPEYAMTGHLLVKSDVYSYGVVLLELLSGRKPVDMSMPPGQENLVAWARPLLPTPEGLNLLIDPSLSPEVPFDSIAKVSAIASMCVQPEVTHRPFMGEVVQALKLVCNECEETRDLGSRSCSQEDLTSVDFDPRVSTNSGPARPTYPGYESPLDVESGFSTSGLGLDVDSSYRMSSSSGPLRPRRRPHLWERMKRFSSGSLSDYGDFLRLLSRSR